MKRQTFNILVDTLALVGLVFLVATGLFLRYVLPPGSGRSVGVWGLTKHEWGDIHFWIAVFIIVIVTLHLALHWQWIICAIQKKPREGSGMRAGLGVAGLITLLLISSAPFLSPKEQLESPANQELKQHQTKKHKDSTTPEPIRGSMSLEDVELLTQVPIAHILKELNLPEDVFRDQKLGQLKQKHSFELERVRRIVNDYHQK